MGGALSVLGDAAPDVRVVNLETAITGDRDFAPGEGVHYRVSPANLSRLAAARPEPPCLGGQSWGRVR
ncbi:CapA family protein [Streptomyces sp. NPDC056237]|uniref:CapA family protein n=1 Tax=unclassified Streptomyces TaxID=2593676 RepID=UPI0035DA9234